MKQSKILLFLALLAQLLVGCAATNIDVKQRLAKSVVKDLPFRVDSIYWVEGGDIPTLKFINVGCINYPPDAEIRYDDSYVGNVFYTKPPTRQYEGDIWRNVVVSRKKQRVVCIDRYLRNGHTEGYCYVLQSERKDYHFYGVFFWDVSDPRNIEMTGTILKDLRETAIRRRYYDVNQINTPTLQDTIIGK